MLIPHLLVCLWNNTNIYDKINLGDLMKTYEFGNNKYTFSKGEEDLLKNESLKDLVTDYFDVYDYIFVDEAYNKLRLKGFYNEKNKNSKDINSIKGLDNYIKNYCAYGSRWVLLEKIKENK